MNIYTEAHRSQLANQIAHNLRDGMMTLADKWHDKQPEDRPLKHGCWELNATLVKDIEKALCFTSDAFLSCIKHPRHGNYSFNLELLMERHAGAFRYKTFDEYFEEAYSSEQMTVDEWINEKMDGDVREWILRWIDGNSETPDYDTDPENWDLDASAEHIREVLSKCILTPESEPSYFLAFDTIGWRWEDLFLVELKEFYRGTQVEALAS